MYAFDQAHPGTPLSRNARAGPRPPGGPERMCLRFVGPPPEESPPMGRSADPRRQPDPFHPISRSTP